jgi:CrcB protein
MTAAILLAVGLLGGAGAVARFTIDGAIARRVSSEFPAGTLAVNLSGTLLLGVLVGAALHGNGERLLGTGLLGAYTTFSTWAFESHRLGEDNRLSLGLVNFVVSLLAGLAAAAVGRHLGAIL